MSPPPPPASPASRPARCTSRLQGWLCEKAPHKTGWHRWRGVVDGVTVDLRWGSRRSR